MGVLAIAAVAGILMTSNQVPANASIGQAQTLGSISQPNAGSTPGGQFSRRPGPPRNQHRGYESRPSDRPSDRWRGRPQRYQERPHDRYRWRRGENAQPRERLSRSEKMMRELQNDPSFPEIIVREK